MPVNRRSIQLMSNTGQTMNQISDVVKGDSYYGFSDGLHTISVTYNQFVGRLRIQGTLSLNPTEADWFDILPEFTNGRSFNERGWVQFNSNDPAKGTEAYTFRANIAFVRVYMDRRHVADGATYDPYYGSIDRVILSS